MLILRQVSVVRGRSRNYRWGDDADLSEDEAPSGVQGPSLCWRLGQTTPLPLPERWILFHTWQWQVFACTFAYELSQYAERSVGLLYL